MKKTIKISLLILLSFACKENLKEQVTEPTSDFDLNSDLVDFKQKMTELDTLIVLFDHSICTYQGFERIEITKESSSIRVHSEFKESFNNAEWDLVYDKNISVNDTIWEFGQFIERNLKKQVTDKKSRAILTVSNNKDTIRFFTDGLVTLNQLLGDYYVTMRKIYPENKNGIYGYEIIEE